MANTVSLCMIVKNEAHNIAELMGDVLPVLEEVIVVDTGSTDGTLDILNKLAAENTNLKLHHFEWVEDFSAARNYSFSLATMDWVLWLDGDDRIDLSSLKKFKEHFLDDPSTDAWVLDYIYSKFEDGSPALFLGRERFIRRSLSKKWQGAIHETIDITGVRDKFYADLKVEHNRKGKIIDPHRNVRILEKEYAKNPNHPRTAYYYGKELFDRVDPKGIEILEHYLKLDGKYWDDEINARSRLAFHYLSVKNHRRAIDTINEVYHLDITRRRAEFYFVYGRTEQDLNNFAVAIEWFERCLKEVPPAPRVLNLEYYTWKPHKHIAECYRALGDYAKALSHAAQAIKMIPKDLGMANWSKAFKQITPPAVRNLKILEFSSKSVPLIRADSQSAGPFEGAKYKCDLFDSPFADQCVDGVIVRDITLTDALQKEIFRILKPAGFLWVESQKASPDYFGHLGSCNFNQYKVENHIRINPLLPTIAHSIGIWQWGPWRIRIDNLVKSAIKSGYKTVSMDKPNVSADVAIARLWTEDVQSAKSPIRVFDVCELLDFYDPKMLEWATVINACSPLLAEHMKKFTKKPIINIDDHFELSIREWL